MVKCYVLDQERPLDDCPLIGHGCQDANTCLYARSRRIRAVEKPYRGYIRNWRVEPYMVQSQSHLGYRIWGDFYGHPRFADGYYTHTSMVVNVKLEPSGRVLIETLNSIYGLRTAVSPKVNEDTSMSTAQKGDIYIDARGDVWRVVDLVSHPVAHLRRVRDGVDLKGTTGAGSGAWKGFERVYRPAQSKQSAGQSQICEAENACDQEEGA